MNESIQIELSTVIGSILILIGLIYVLKCSLMPIMKFLGILLIHTYLGTKFNRKTLLCVAGLSMGLLGTCVIFDNSDIQRKINKWEQLKNTTKPEKQQAKIELNRYTTDSIDIAKHRYRIWTWVTLLIAGLTVLLHDPLDWDVVKKKQQYSIVRTVHFRELGEWQLPRMLQYVVKVFNIQHKTVE